MAQFKCLVSGNFVNFNTQYDIEVMMKHPEYELVNEESLKQEDVKKSVGRPKKVQEHERD
jgi:hypothetical protein|tara:strand:+ start:643 stop:822 length:180 start_codon:yes stop_codon:yes gene_type:complete